MSVGTKLTALAVIVAGLATALVATAGPAAAVMEPSACRISGPLAVKYRDFDGPFTPGFVSYQAGNGRGTFAGASWTDTADGAVARIVRYSAGRVTVLDTIVYANGSYEPPDGSIKVVGVDGWGNVIVREQPPSTWWESQAFETVRSRPGARADRQLGDRPGVRRPGG